MKLFLVVDVISNNEYYEWMTTADDDKKASEGDFLLKFADTKKEDVGAIYGLISKTGVRTVRKSIRYYPFRFFADGVLAYIYSFNNAVIYYAGTAVEIGLLIKLKPQIERERKRKPKFNPTFKWLVSHSKSLLGQHLETANNLRLMRNCYLHYENIVAHTAWMDQVEFPDTVKKVKAIFKTDRKVTEKLESLLKLNNEQVHQTGMLTVRFDFLESNKEMMAFVENRYKDYFNWLPETWSAKRQSMKNEDFNLLYDIEAFDALTSINWSFEILKALNFLPYIQ